ncbi:MlaD family protein [Amycolatopsis sp.]|uniref:MlaD family protein n=1 Tax=Amycolatopsis sp. TaxID=37632 RepID=UPI002E00FEA6|nr:MlaD family protein [Amycolatopsis sp.]
MSATSSRRTNTIRLATVITFLTACAGFVGYLWTQAGGSLPGITSDQAYTVSANVDDVDNLVPYTDVNVAGISLGKVTELTPVGKTVRITLRLDPSIVPLHEGTTVQVSEKSLVGQPVVRVVDGQGPEIPSGTQLPASAVKPSVQLHDVLAGLDPKTKDALGSTLRSLGAGTQGTSVNVSQVMDGLGKLGSNGHTALDAIAAQSQDLQEFARQLSTVLDSLNSGQGDLGRLVDAGNQLASATAGQHDALANSMKELPGTLTSVRTATGKLRELSGSLAPIAANLNTAAPALTDALNQLPSATKDLRAMLPSLNGVLDGAPATLNRVPTLVGDAGALIPQLRERLRDLNPMAAYLSPYGRDIGAFLANFRASFAHKTTDGKNVLALFAVANEESVRGNPVNLGGGLTVGTNAYPAPGQQATRTPFSGNYPRLVKDPG